jgi:quercetin dioxygenase-like cupin family protein
MSAMVKKSFDAPDEVRSVDKGKVEVVDLGNVKAMRTTFQPGWRWSECVKPIVKTDSCQVAHLIHVHSGRMVCKMDDGSEVEFGPGDVGVIPPGHDAWIVGDEAFVGVDFQGGGTYAKPQS